MNTQHLLLTGLVTMLWQFCPAAAANPITLAGSASPGQVIPDNDLSGLASTIYLSAPPSAITSVSLTLDIVGAPIAYNGDYYAYLQFNTGLFVLLNNIGPAPYGSPGNGINVTLSDGNPTIATAPFAAGQSLTGTYAPEGGGASTGNSLGNTFDGLNPNGGWTLFIADESPGGVGELADWSLDVTANTPGIPDTGRTMGLLVLGVGSLGLWFMRKLLCKAG
jgi:subtilisin-like proprotein convertase family protein